LKKDVRHKQTNLVEKKVGGSNKGWVVETQERKKEQKNKPRKKPRKFLRKRYSNTMRMQNQAKLAAGAHHGKGTWQSI